MIRKFKFTTKSFKRYLTTHQPKDDIFAENQIIPDVFTNLYLTQDLLVYYNQHLFHNGQELSPLEVSNKPVIHFHPKKGEFYSLCMIDPDAPTRNEPKFREWVHWLVINIPDNGKVEEGHEVIEYIGANPAKRTGYHRYVFALFEHPEKIKHHEEKIIKKDRGNWSVKDFMKKHHLHSPIGVSFFISEIL